MSMWRTDSRGKTSVGGEASEEERFLASASRYRATHAPGGCCGGHCGGGGGGGGGGGVRTDWQEGHYPNLARDSARCDKKVWDMGCVAVNFSLYFYS